jgi:hypothetical protein
MPDSIPRKEEDVLNFSANLFVGCRKYAALLGLSPGKITELETQRAKCETLHAKCKTPARSHIDVEAKDKAFELFIGNLRKYIENHLQHNDNMTDEIRAELGLHIKKKASKQKVVNRPPVITADTSILRELLFSFYVHGSKRKGKPKGMHGCKFRYLISDHPPASIHELVNSEVATGRTLKLKFDEADRGKKVYYAACWVTESGDMEGEYTDIFVTIVP